MLEVPAKILQELNKGAELGPLMQKYSQEDNLRSKE
jgi:non-canonical (house-cleaning) NTP pyrophosphatase